MASILKYSDVKKAINRNVNEADQRMLSYEECKVLFGNNLEIEEDIEVAQNVEFLLKWKEVTVVKNFTTVKLQNSVGAVKETQLYDLAVQLRTDSAMEIRSKFSDILVEVETTGSYNAQIQSPSYMVEDPIERAMVPNVEFLKKLKEIQSAKNFADWKENIKYILNIRLR